MTLSITEFERLRSWDKCSTIFRLSFDYLSIIFRLSFDYHSTIFPLSFHYLSTIFPPSFHHPSTIFPLSFHYLSTIFPLSFHYLSFILCFRSERNLFLVSVVRRESQAIHLRHEPQIDSHIRSPRWIRNFIFSSFTPPYKSQRFVVWQRFGRLQILCHGADHCQIWGRWRVWKVSENNQCSSERQPWPDE